MDAKTNLVEKLEMSTERTLNKEDIVKHEILEAARRVFQKWGLNKTTMEDIASEAGKGKSTLYYYYKSKDEIFHELAVNEISSMITKAKDSIIDLSSAKEKLKRYMAVMLTEIKKTVGIFPLLRGEMKGNKALVEKITTEMNKKEATIIIEIFKLGLDSGEFNFLNESNLEKSAKVVVGLIRGVELYLFLDNDEDDTIDIVTRLISEGI